MSDILPPDALLPMRQYLTFVGRNTEPHEVQPNSPFDMIRRLVDSHEALRARLAEVEADRDRWHAAYEEEVEVGGARLVEAVELLRALMGVAPVSLEVEDAIRNRARVFIEEQGQ